MLSGVANMEKIRNLKLKNSEIVTLQKIESGCFEKDGRRFESLPKICRVVIKSAPGPGSEIISEVWLPDNWNGIFVGLGNGGMAGVISYDALTTYARRGYAAAHTDMGTSRGRNSGIDNPDVWKDFGYRATHIMTEESKALISAYYGRCASYSYFIGASTGGQQAYSEAQRFPEDYDGILAEVPANNRVFLHTYFLWNHNHLRLKDGTVMFSAEEVNQITDCAVEFFKAEGDGEKEDDFVTFPYNGKETIDSFLKFLRERCPHFTKEQTDALKAVYCGPVNPKTNQQIYNGMPQGSEIYGCGILECQEEESPHFYPFVWAFGEDYDGYQFDFADDLDRLDRVLSKTLNANCADLTEFCKGGGKMVAFSGSADPCVPYPDAVKYYNRVCEKMGGYENTNSFFRYFILPGRAHGAEGRGVNAVWSNEKRDDMLHMLRDWCERGKAPEYLVTAHIDEADNIKFIRKVYPYKGDKREERDFPKSWDTKYIR